MDCGPVAEELSPGIEVSEIQFQLRNGLLGCVLNADPQGTHLGCGGLSQVKEFKAHAPSLGDEWHRCRGPGLGWRDLRWWRCGRFIPRLQITVHYPGWCSRLERGD